MVCTTTVASVDFITIIIATVIVCGIRETTEVWIKVTTGVRVCIGMITVLIVADHLPVMHRDDHCLYLLVLEFAASPPLRRPLMLIEFVSGRKLTLTPLSPLFTSSGLVFLLGLVEYEP
jgi:hypothetical protein